jgi:dipeptidyl aminopeptidase/acylaminoacyl peptidase
VRYPSRVGLSIAAFFSGLVVRGASFEEKVTALYRPWESETAALAPDGRHLAYTRHVKNELWIAIVDVEDPTQRTNIAVADDKVVMYSREKQPVKLRYLRWFSATRLVFAPEEEEKRVLGLGGSRRISSPILAVNADGSEPRTLADGPDFSYMIELPPPAIDGPPGGPDVGNDMFARNTRIVGRKADEPDFLLVEAHGLPPPRPTVPPIPTTLFKINVNTGKTEMLADNVGRGAFLYDQTGRARVFYSQPERERVWPFLLQPPKSGNWRDPGNGSDRLTRDFAVTVENYFGARSVPLAVDFDPRVLLVASNLGRDTFGVYGWNVETRQRTALAIEHPYVDLAGLEPNFTQPPLVFDFAQRKLAGVRGQGVTSFTTWLDAELAAIQASLDRKFPRRTVEILDWDDRRQTILFRVGGPGDPGRTYIFKRTENLVTEFLRRAPWLRPEDLNESSSFEFDTPAGVHLTGYLTVPRTPRINPPPLVIYLPAGFLARAQSDFDRDAQALADLGFLVARVNYRGGDGFGAKHRTGIQSGIDRAPVDDLLATVEWLAQHHAVDRRRIATMGEGFGGYLAVRALELAPDTFRCAIALDAPLDLERWLRPPADSTIVDLRREARYAFLQHSGVSLAQTSALRDVERLTKPVMLIVGARSGPEIEAQNGELRAALRKRGRTQEYLALDSADFALGLPGARAKVFRRIEEFFNLNLYDYKVKVGEVEEKR